METNQKFWIRIIITVWVEFIFSLMMSQGRETGAQTAHRIAVMAAFEPVLFITSSGSSNTLEPFHLQSCVHMSKMNVDKLKLSMNCSY